MNTTLLLYLVGGVALGWLAEYLLDLRFWRKTNSRLQSSYALMERRLESASTDLHTLQMHVDSTRVTLTEREKDVKNLKILSRLLTAQLKQAQSERDQAIEQAKRIHAELARFKPDFDAGDDFEPTIIEFHDEKTVAEQLSTAGVRSLDALSKLSDSELYGLVSSEKRRLAKGQGAWRAASA